MSKLFFSVIFTIEDDKLWTPDLPDSGVLDAYDSQLSETDTSANGGKNHRNRARGVNFCGGSLGQGSCGQGSHTHRGGRGCRGGRGHRASHGHGCSRVGGHGGKI